MCDSRYTTEPMAHDFCSRKSRNENERNQITHGILFPYSTPELSHNLVNGNACNKKYAVSLYVNICFHHAKCLQNCDNIFF